MYCDLVLESLPVILSGDPHSKKNKKPAKVLVSNKGEDPQVSVWNTGSSGEMFSERLT